MQVLHHISCHRQMFTTVELVCHGHPVEYDCPPVSQMRSLRHREIKSLGHSLEDQDLNLGSRWHCPICLPHICRVLLVPSVTSLMHPLGALPLGQAAGLSVPTLGTPCTGWNPRPGAPSGSLCPCGTFGRGWGHF